MIATVEQIRMPAKVGEIAAIARILDLKGGLATAKKQTLIGLKFRLDEFEEAGLTEVSLIKEFL